MKTKIIISFAVLTFLVLFAVIKYQFVTIQANTVKSNLQKEDETQKEKEVQKEEKVSELKMQIPIISDIHIGVDKQQEIFTNVLKQYNELAPNFDAIVSDGDITNTGYVPQYDAFMKILNENVNSNTKKIIAMGNHEYFEGVHEASSGLNDADLKNRFIEKTGMPGVYYDEWIKGYHFIVLGGEESSVSNSNNKDNAIISDEQYAWLQKTIAEDVAANKPIFVFLHQPIENTVYGSELWGGIHDNKLSNILKNYPQSILFSGHTHYLLTHPKMVYQDGFTMVNTGGLLDTYYGEGDENESNGPDLIQGLLVNVYNDKVEIKARDFKSGTWINSYTIKVPFQKTIYDDQKPTFPDTASVKVDNLSTNSATLTWDAAIDNIQVDKYVIKENETILANEYMKFWENNKSKSVSINLSKLDGKSTYNLKIYAVDAWGNVCDKPLNITLNTQ